MLFNDILKLLSSEKMQKIYDVFIKGIVQNLGKYAESLSCSELDDKIRAGRQLAERLKTGLAVQISKQLQEGNTTC